jgi:hypothetical protein
MILRRVTELNAVLADWDEAKLPDGSIKTFSVGFVSKKSEYRFIKRGIKSGLRFSMKDTDMKGVQPVDKNGEEFGHVYPVWIHSIIFYSGNVIFNIHDRI